MSVESARPRRVASRAPVATAGDGVWTRVVLETHATLAASRRVRLLSRAKTREA